MFKVDLHLTYKKPVNVNRNTAYISVNNFPITVIIMKTPNN